MVEASLILERRLNLLMIEEVSLRFKVSEILYILLSRGSWLSMLRIFLYRTWPCPVKASLYLLAS